MLVILDTNVWISALLFGGTPLLVVAQCRQPRFTVLASPALYQEFDRVLRETFYVSDVRRSEYNDIVNQATVQVFPVERIDTLGHDPDNRVLECAVAGRADVIISGDKKHLLSLKEFRGIQIVSPAEFLVRFE